MAPGGETYRLYEHFSENVLRHGSHEWLPYSKNAVCTKSSNTNLSVTGWEKKCLTFLPNTVITKRKEGLR